MACILLIEDNPGDARLIRELLNDAADLSNGYDIHHVERLNDALKVLYEPNEVDIILSDITLPDSSGVDTLTALGRAADNLPIIFMTGTNDEALALTAIHQGAQDYLVKGKIDGEVLSRAMRYAQERKKFQNEMDKIRAAAEISKQRIKLLAEQKQQLLKLNRTKDEFISIASHQLRTPATAVKQYIGLIVEGFVGEVSERQAALLKTAYDSNERQLEVISELLKTAQLDSTSFKLHLTIENINTIVTEVIAELKPVTDLRSQQIIFDSSKEFTACVDRIEIKLVIENIIENASKYTHAGKDIHVSLTTSGGKVYIKVADQGVGITKANQKLIFEKFSRVDNELSDTVSGSGLGLYWAKQIMRMHKGKIRVDSKPGIGSEFTLVLPA